MVHVTELLLEHKLYLLQDFHIDHNLYREEHENLTPFGCFQQKVKLFIKIITF